MGGQSNLANHEQFNLGVENSLRAFAGAEAQATVEFIVIFNNRRITTGNRSPLAIAAAALVLHLGPLILRLVN